MKTRNSRLLAGIILLVIGAVVFVGNARGNRR